MNGQKQSNINSLPLLDSYRFENLFNVYNANDKYFYNLLSTVTFPANIATEYYTIYTVPYDNITWTDISNKIYGTPSLWWVICSVNGINNPIEFPKAGTVLKMLDTNIVSQVLQSLKT